MTAKRVKSITTFTPRRCTTIWLGSLFCVRRIVRWFYLRKSPNRLLKLKIAQNPSPKTKRYREKAIERDETRTKKRKLNRVTKTRELWEEMEKSEKSFESWQQTGLKTPTKPRKPKPKPKKTKKKAKKRVSKKRALTKRSSKKRVQGKVRSSFE